MKTPLYAADGGLIGIQAIFWDVTARIRAEEQLREKNAELEGLARSEHQAHEALKQAQSLLVQNEKLASLGQLVAGVAHEINNPLAFVSNNVAVLERDLRDLLRLIEIYRAEDGRTTPRDPAVATELAEILERIDLEYCLDNFPRLIERTREGLRRIERIVKELRLFARVDEGEWNEVDLNPGIESSINMVKGYARKKGVQIVMDLGALPAVRCRAARIHQVILNLLTNAIDACGENGQVTVRTETEADALGVRVDIDDNGGGIAPEIRDRIFDPFFTTKPLGQGTGLGLSISYGIIQEHNGRIEVQSTVGYGSCFSIHMPIEPSRSPYGTAAAGRGTAFGIEKTREIGFDCIDVFADPLDLDARERRLIRTECARAGLPIVSLPCVAVGLIDFNPSVQRFHASRVRAYLDLAYELEARNVLLVVGEYIWQKEVIPPAEQWATGVARLQELGDYAADLGLEIALELEPFAMALLNDVPSMARFLDDVDRPSVKANIDVSHLVLAKEPPESIESLRGRVAHVHISDCDGKVHGDLPPGRGVVDFPPYLAAIKRLGIDDATVSIELEYSPDPARIVEWVEEAYATTAALMREAGLRP
ncbi:hypothetical protein HK102_009618, partial [Quaeritorhiza haematococci]